MFLRKLLQRIRQTAIVGIAWDTRGAAAVELALITPALLAVFFGTNEAAQAVAVDRKVTITARSLSDLVAQSTSITNADMTNIFSAASAILSPYPITTLTARVSAVNINAAGTVATVVWSNAYGNISPRGTGDVVTIPPALRIPNTQLIWSEISYDYTPPVAKYITGALNLTDEFFARPRQSNTICRPPAVTTCS
jgi:Flp pilus assembly protein TadG